MFSRFDLFYSLRLIRKRIGFNLLFISVVALGFSISIPLYSITKNLVFPSLPGSKDSQLVIIEQVDSRNNRGMTTNSFDSFQLNYIRDNADSFESISGLIDIPATFSDGETIETYFGTSLEVSALSMMETAPILGRAFTTSDELQGAEPVVLLSHDLWTQYYAGDPDVVGMSIPMNGEFRTVIGVMPEGFRHPQVHYFWLPLTIPSVTNPGELTNIGLFGVLKEHVSIENATTEVSELVSALSQRLPDEYPFRTAKVIPYSHGWVNSIATFEMAGVISVSLLGLVFLNVCNLLLISANRRIAELAIRTTVGAKKTNLILHVLSESFLICTLGVVFGALLSSQILNWLQFFFTNIFIGGGLLYWFDFHFDLEILFISIMVLAVFWLIAGLFAAWRTTRSDIALVLGGGATGKAANSPNRVASVLVVSQVILSFFLLLVSCSYLYSFVQGFRSEVVQDEENYLSAYWTSSSETFASKASELSFQTQLQDGIRNISNVESVTFSSTNPGNNGRRVAVAMSATELLEQPTRPQFGEVSIAESYFETLRLSVIEGRSFDPGDSQNSEPVALVDNAFVDLMQLDESPVGRLLYLQDNSNSEIRAVRIVGLVPTIEGGSVLSKVYRPISQTPSRQTYLIAKLRDADGPLAELERQIRLTAAASNRTIALSNFQTLSRYTQSLNSWFTLHVGMFGTPVLGALLLSIIGIYGLIARSIHERIHEIGIRRALGSPNWLILKLSMHRGATYLLLGAAIGGGGALVALNYVSISGAMDSSWPVLTTIFTVIVAVIGAIVALASYLPAREAIAIEPGEALHYE